MERGGGEGESGRDRNEIEKVKERENKRYKEGQTEEKRTREEGGR